MIYKVLESKNGMLFEKLYKNNIDKIIANNLGDEALDIKILLTYPHITKIDILEYFEYYALSEAGLDYEIDEAFLGRYDIYPLDNLSKELCENDPRPSYASEYIGVIGELFLGEMIDFELKDEERSLFYAFNSSFEAWRYFRDKFLLTYTGFLYDFDRDNVKTSWENPSQWNSWDINVARTPEGTKYFNEILCPRFYKKYKDLEVEIDSKGNIVRWIGEINR
ncbi:hypothetical protein CCZ01_07635 [Helicobacter monodelphidis]|uniref:hypothetical protein n=1 Tax=Helicobacter sp. 15-1451 TaxID=2004995 RepID=UPI000DCC77B7|nr:hypothetical protein [Helicobacter sp. 15-1451]RAX57030.1 hypothetical protein CCZ01_07635 [Helicobacter sp. 15-1451]